MTFSPRIITREILLAEDNHLCLNLRRSAPQRVQRSGEGKRKYFIVFCARASLFERMLKMVYPHNSGPATYCAASRLNKDSNITWFSLRIRSKITLHFKGELYQAI